MDHPRCRGFHDGKCSADRIGRRLALLKIGRTDVVGGFMSNQIFGPVPSRRLGRSLGVDLVPFKTCTYDGIYCQLGQTTCRTMERKEWVPLDGVLEKLKEKLSTKPDYITLSGSGEPTLYSRVDELIAAVPAELAKVAKCVDRICPDRVQLNTVTRPPAEKYAVGVSSERLVRTYVDLPPSCRDHRRLSRRSSTSGIRRGPRGDAPDAAKAPLFRRRHCRWTRHAPK